MVLERADEDDRWPPREVKMAQKSAESVVGTVTRKENSVLLAGPNCMPHDVSGLVPVTFVAKCIS